MSKKKLMALLLTGVMAASTVSVPVFAEEAEGGSSDTPLVIGQTIKEDNQPAADAEESAASCGRLTFLRQPPAGSRAWWSFVPLCRN